MGSAIVMVSSLPSLSPPDVDIDYNMGFMGVPGAVCAVRRRLNPIGYYCSDGLPLQGSAVIDSLLAFRCSRRKTLTYSCIPVVSPSLFLSPKRASA